MEPAGYDDIEIEDWHVNENEEEKGELDLLLIGDSIVRHVDTDRLIPRGQKSLNRCLSGKVTADIRTELKVEASKSDIKNELYELLSENLSSYKHPIDILFFDSLPKTHSGKLKRREVRRIIEDEYNQWSKILIKWPEKSI